MAKSAATPSSSRGASKKTPGVRGRGSSGDPTLNAGKHPVKPHLAQADIHRRTRRAHSLEVAEDYIETIADLMEQSGEARVVDIARRLGVTHVTVTRTIARLRAGGLVIAKPYRSIFLTDEGKRMAERVRKRHEVVVAFLLSLGLSAETAHVDAEGIEHHVSAETLSAFQRYVAAQR